MRTSSTGRILWLLPAFVLTVAGFAGMLFAQDADTTNTSEDDTALVVDLKPRKAIILSTQDAIRLTMQNSTEIRIDSITPRRTALDITRAEARFDWRAVGSLSHSHSEAETTTSISGGNTTKSESDTLEVGLKKTLRTGGQIKTAIDWERSESWNSFSSVNPSYTTDLYITISQPLMRNAGSEVNLSEVNTTRNNLNIARYNFKSNVISTLADMQDTYWNLVFSIEDLEVRKKALRLTTDTLELTRHQVTAGLLAPIEITRIRAENARKEEAILIALQRVEDREDELRRYLNIDSGNLASDIGVIPLEREAYPTISPQVSHEIAQALRHRPDYRAAKLTLITRDIELVVAKNAKLPVIDLAASFSLNGFERTTAKSLSQINRARHDDWTMSFTFEVPIGNRAARADYNKAKLAKAQTLLELKNMEDAIIVTIKQHVRQVHTNIKRIRTSRLGRELSEERLRAEEMKFDVGAVQILDVLEAQTSLAEAESGERRAIVDYNKSCIALEKAKGTLLEHNGVFLSRELGPPEYYQK